MREMVGIGFPFVTSLSDLPGGTGSLFTEAPVTGSVTANGITPRDPWTDELCIAIGLADDYTRDTGSPSVEPVAPQQPIVGKGQPDANKPGTAL